MGDLMGTLGDLLLALWIGEDCLYALHDWLTERGDWRATVVDIEMDLRKAEGLLNLGHPYTFDLLALFLEVPWPVPLLPREYLLCHITPNLLAQARFRNADRQYGGYSNYWLPGAEVIITGRRRADVIAKFELRVGEAMMIGKPVSHVPVSVWARGGVVVVESPSMDRGFYEVTSSADWPNRRFAGPADYAPRIVSRPSETETE